MEGGETLTPRPEAWWRSLYLLNASELPGTDGCPTGIFTAISDQGAMAGDFGIRDVR